MLDLPIIVQVTIWGLILGCIYAIIAAGLSLIFGVMKLLNFAHGEFIMLGGYVTFWLWSVLNINPYIVIPLTMLIIGSVGSIIHRLCFRPILGTEKLNEFLISFALIYIISYTVIFFWGSESKTVQSPYRAMNLPLGVINLGIDQAILILITALTFIFLFLLIKKTRLGLTIRAVSQSREASRTVGINVDRIDMLTFVLSAMLGALAGALLSQILDINPHMGLMLVVIAYVITVFGGMESIAGAITGAFIIGVIQQLTAFLLGGSWALAMVFILLTMILVLKPSGLFGKRWM